MQLDEIVGNVQDVVPLPKAYLRIRELVEDPESSLDDITRVISNDPGLTSRILRIANSAYFGLTSKVDTIGRAVQVLGLNQVHDLALANAAVGSLAKIAPQALDIYDFWRRSIYCAIVARLLARRLDLRSGERLFVCGLLHEIGHLILAHRAPELFQELRTAWVRRQTPLALLERELLGFDYAAISAAVLEGWQLPAELVEPVRGHVDALTSLPPAQVHDAAILHVAAIISRGAMWSTEADEPVPEFDPAAMQLTRLDDALTEALMADADPQVVEAMSLLLPDMKARAKRAQTA